MALEFQPGKCLVIAEVAQAHDGSLGAAHAFIDTVARAGADAVKFQTHIAAAESSPAEPWRVKFSFQDETRFDYWRRMEFTEEQWAGLQKHATERGLLFLSSPFSIEAAEMLRRIGVPAWKVASGEIANRPLLDFLLSTRLPMLISTGMSPIKEIDGAVSLCREAGVPAAVMQCTSKYPCPPSQIGLNMLSYYRERYRLPVGLSDHSGSIYPSLAAAALGASVVEVHVTFSREAFGPDVKSSVIPLQLRRLVKGVRQITAMLAPVDKDAMARELGPTRELFTRSVIVLRDIPSGAIIERRDLGLRKPGTGIPAQEIDNIAGAYAMHDLPSGTFLTRTDFAWEKASAGGHRN